MSIRKEYETLVAMLRETAYGTEILDSLSALSIKAASGLRAGKFLTDGPHASLAGAVLSFLGEAAVAKIVEENAILLCGRLILMGRLFDTMDQKIRLEICCNLLMQMLTGLQEWGDREDQVHESLPDKKARRHQRHERQDEDLRLREQLSLSENDFVEKLTHLLLPNGVDSLLLPPGASFFSGKLTALLNELQKTIASNVQMLFSKERKVDLLCQAYAHVYIWICKGCSANVTSDIVIPQALLERLLARLNRPIELLFPYGEQYVRFFPKEKIAAKIVALLGGVLQKTSLENLVLRLLAQVLVTTNHTPRTTKDLDFITDKLCTDETVFRSIMKKFTPEEPVETISTPLDLLFKGLQSTLAQKTALQAIPWKAIFAHLLEEVRFFVLSVYWNRSSIEGLKMTLDYIESPPSTTMT